MGLCLSEKHLGPTHKLSLTLALNKCLLLTQFKARNDEALDIARDAHRNIPLDQLDTNEAVSLIKFANTLRYTIIKHTPFKIKLISCDDTNNKLQ